MRSSASLRTLLSGSDEEGGEVTGIYDRLLSSSVLGNDDISREVWLVAPTFPKRSVKSMPSGVFHILQPEAGKA
jgi:hypothetical protein